MTALVGLHLDPQSAEQGFLLEALLEGTITVATRVKILIYRVYTVLRGWFLILIFNFERGHQVYRILQLQ